MNEEKIMAELKEICEAIYKPEYFRSGIITGFSMDNIHANLEFAAIPEMKLQVPFDGTKKGFISGLQNEVAKISETELVQKILKRLIEERDSLIDGGTPDSEIPDENELLKLAEQDALWVLEEINAVISELASAFDVKL